MPAERAENLDDALRTRGLRSTLQRRLVLDAVTVLGHCTPEQVCERVQDVAPALSLSTVYRTLELLESLGVITHTHLGHGALTYAPASHDDHIHLVCRRCGAVMEADVTQARALAAEVHERYGFATDVNHLALDGVCAGCAGHEHDHGSDRGRDAVGGPGHQAGRSGKHHDR
jgi:Fur family transcriptional regulator, ferric uptake regulator